MMKSLVQLLPNFNGALPACQVTGLSLNTQTLRPGELFIALPGTHQNGLQFIQEAITKGASGVLYEASLSLTQDFETAIPILPVPNLKMQVGHIAARFYDDPSADLSVIGVTGTNGKSTCVHLLSEALNVLGMPCASIGTLGACFQGASENFGLTTPDPITLQRLFYELKLKGAKAVAIEVSSHALAQSRVAGVHFQGAVFTNLTQDHLDYHQSMSAYLAEKAKLFAMPDLKFMVLNQSDLATNIILETAHPVAARYVYDTTLNEPAAISNAHSNTLLAATFGSSGLTATLESGSTVVTIETRLLGDFNLENLLAVISTLQALGFPLEKIAPVFKEILPVPGRMTCLTRVDKPIVIIDYAHTPDALEKALRALRPYAQGALWCIFGCGGDRDTSKRPQMGQAACQLADKIILTNDNPRTESPDQIMTDILTGIPNESRGKIQIEFDRQAAIAYALSHATSADVVLIAGKGHEDYQIVGTERLSFSDIACVEGLLD